MTEEEKWISNLNFWGKKGDQKYMQMAAYLLLSKMIYWKALNSKAVD